MTTQQATPDKDMNRNPKGKGGFGDNPQNRNPGGWKKEESISYQYNRLIRFSPDELDKFIPKTIAEKVALKRVKEMLEDNNATKGGALQVTKEVTDRIEGKAPQFIGLGDGDDYDNRTGATIVFEDKPEE